MAVVAGNAIVHAFECVAGLLLVIELRGLPVLGDVALATPRAAIAMVHIVGLVTGDAVLGRALVAIAEVAGGAGHFRMPGAQREGRLVMGVTDLAPGAGALLRGGLLCQIAF